MINFQMARLEAMLFSCASAVSIGNTSACPETKSEALSKFKETFGPASANPKVKAMFAQWMTAMDTAGSRVGKQEEAKFNTLANELKLD